MDTDDIPELVTELKALRRGYGIEARDLRLGRLLTEVCGVTDADGPHTRREKVSAKLDVLIGQLPKHLRDVAIGALGMRGTATLRYEGRMRVLGDVADRDLRTMQRRVEDVFRRIAELAAAGPAKVGRGRQAPPWHTSRLTVSVMLDLPVVEVVETRRIVSHQPGLAEVDHSVTVDPAPGWDGSATPPELGIDLFKGGILHSPQWLAANRIGYRIRLPEPLDPEQEHEFAYRIRMASTFAPRYVCTPKHRCDAFALTVRFGPERVPGRIWLLEHETPHALNDLQPPRKPLEADKAGEVHAEFLDLEPNRSYGIGWDPVAR